MDDASHQKLRYLRHQTAEVRKLSEAARQESRRIIDQSRELLAEPHDPLVTKILRATSRKITTHEKPKR